MQYFPCFSFLRQKQQSRLFPTKVLQLMLVFLACTCTSILSKSKQPLLLVFYVSLPAAASSPKGASAIIRLLQSQEIQQMKYPVGKITRRPFCVFCMLLQQCHLRVVLKCKWCKRFTLCDFLAILFELCRLYGPLHKHILFGHIILMQIGSSGLPSTLSTFAWCSLGHEEQDITLLFPWIMQMSSKKSTVQCVRW